MKLELIGVVLEAIKNNISKDYHAVKDNYFDDIIVYRKTPSPDYIILRARIKFYDNYLSCESPLNLHKTENKYQLANGYHRTVKALILPIDYNNFKIDDIINFISHVNELLANKTATQ